MTNKFKKWITKGKNDERQRIEARLEKKCGALLSYTFEEDVKITEKVEKDFLKLFRVLVLDVELKTKPKQKESVMVS